MTKTCSFCEKTMDQVERIITGPGDIHICNECVAASRDILAGTAVAGWSETTEAECHFCGQGPAPDRRIVAREGSDARICAACHVLCVEVLAEAVQQGG